MIKPSLEKKSSQKNTKFKINKIKNKFAPLKETEKLQILLAQLKIANEKWTYFEEQRLKTLEIFLSYSGLSALGIFLSITKKFSSDLSNELKILKPFIFFLIGWFFFSLYWYREYYFQLTKSWCERIEAEIQLIYKGNQRLRNEDFDGAYRIYYYGTNFDKKEKKFEDWSSYFHGTAIASITIIITLFSCIFFFLENIKSSKGILTTICGVIIATYKFFGTREFILHHCNEKYTDNFEKWAPLIKGE